MTLEGLKTILDGTELPVAYLAFPEDQAPEMPFIVYQELGSDNMGADNIVWHSPTRVQIDLLCRRRSRTTEQTVETALTNAGIFWERDVNFDSDDDFYSTSYNAEI